jgi:hypothetical protein
MSSGDLIFLISTPCSESLQGNVLMCHEREKAEFHIVAIYDDGD